MPVLIAIQMLRQMQERNRVGRAGGNIRHKLQAHQEGDF